MAINLTKLDKSEESQSSPRVRKNSSHNHQVSPLVGQTVLIVEDNRIQRKRLKELYESMGFKCVGEAADGLDALDMAEKLNPSLISLDILMPVMHGVEALGYLREQGSRAKIIFVSSLGSLETIADVKAKGHQPDAIFSKKDSKEMFEEVLWDIFSSIDSDSSSQAS
jgi:two-component system, chemotaxis family, chemotaxis protein CheY